MFFSYFFLFFFIITFRVSFKFNFLDYALQKVEFFSIFSTFKNSFLLIQSDMSDTVYRSLSPTNVLSIVYVWLHLLKNEMKQNRNGLFVRFSKVSHRFISKWNWSEILSGNKRQCKYSKITTFHLDKWTNKLKFPFLCCWRHLKRQIKLSNCEWASKQNKIHYWIIYYCILNEMTMTGSEQNK